jgi:hypothetical protein
VSTCTGPFGEAYLDTIEPYDAASDALLEPSTLFACSPKHARRVPESDEGELSDEAYGHDVTVEVLMLQAPDPFGNGV